MVEVEVTRPIRYRANADMERHSLAIRAYHREYKAWQAMINRCTQPSHPAYPNYGGRGIAVCKDWHSGWMCGGLARFIDHIGPMPGDGYTIDRIDNDRGYEPGNVRWATRKEQSRNRRANRLLTFNGRTQCLTAWADEAGIKENTLRSRLRKKWPHSELLSPTRRNS